MVTNLQSPPVHFDAVRRFTVEEYYRLVEAGASISPPQTCCW